MVLCVYCNLILEHETIPKNDQEGEESKPLNLQLESDIEESDAINEVLEEVKDLTDQEDIEHDIAGKETTVGDVFEALQAEDEANIDDNEEGNTEIKEEADMKSVEADIENEEDNIKSFEDDIKSVEADRSGNYVRKSSKAQTIYGFFRLELIAGGGLPTAEIISLKKLKKPRDLPSFGKSENAFRFRRWRKLNGVNAAVEEIWLDGSYADTIEQSELPDSLYQFYRQSLNLWVGRAEDSVSVAAPPSWKPTDFASNASIWGYIERFSFDQNNTAAEFSRTWFDPTTTRFMARWT